MSCYERLIRYLWAKIIQQEIRFKPKALSCWRSMRLRANISKVMFRSVTYTETWSLDGLINMVTLNKLDYIVRLQILETDLMSVWIHIKIRPCNIRNNSRSDRPVLWIYFFLKALPAHWEPRPLIQFRNHFHRRQDSLGERSVRRKASTLTQDNTNTE
jgi:hypothetical protein